MDKNSLYLIYGSDYKKITQEILNYLNIGQDIPSKDALIGIKPNLVVARPAEEGATTSPLLVEALIEYLQANGFNNIVILEGSWVGDRTSRAFDLCGYRAISEKYKLPLIDLQKDDYKDYRLGDVTLSICNKAMEVDYLINLPVLKGHCQTRITCALKNMKGCIPDREKRNYHTMGLHKPIAYLNKVLKQDLIIVDGIIGDLNFEEGGNPVQMNRIIVGKDPVLVDSYVAELLGYHVEEIPYITIAKDMGLGNLFQNDKSIIELNKDSQPMEIPKTRLIERLSSYVDDNMSCSACYASLIHSLDRLNDRGYLDKMKGPISIGQGFKAIEKEGLGIGVCTRGLGKSLKGCPPKAKDIIDFLIENNT